MNYRLLYKRILQRIDSNSNYSRKYDCVMNPSDENKGHLIKSKINAIEGYLSCLEIDSTDENLIVNYESAIRSLNDLLDALGWD